MDKGAETGSVSGSAKKVGRAPVVGGDRIQAARDWGRNMKRVRKQHAKTCVLPLRHARRKRLPDAEETLRGMLAATSAT